jgi:hypothetical protein
VPVTAEGKGRRSLVSWGVEDSTLNRESTGIPRALIRLDLHPLSASRAMAPRLQFSPRGQDAWAPEKR